MKKLPLASTVVLLLLTSCAPQPPLLKPTSSGYPEGIFSHTTVGIVCSKLIEGCSSRGILVQEVRENQVVCGKTMEGNDAVLGQLLVGNSYSTTPEWKIRFVIYQLGTDVKVIAQQWIESQMALGQIRKLELNHNHQKNTVQQFLFSLGAKSKVAVAIS